MTGVPVTGVVEVEVDEDVDVEVEVNVEVDVEVEVVVDVEVVVELVDDEDVVVVVAGDTVAKYTATPAMTIITTTITATKAVLIPLRRSMCIFG